MKATMSQEERITYMETLLDEGREALDGLKAALVKYRSTVQKIRELESYYESETWMQDFEDDAEGKLPDWLKRGVLSEDAVYSLLTDETTLMEEILALPPDTGDYLTELPPVLEAFFEAENKRDWATYRTYLHPEVKWFLFADEAELIEGVDEYLDVMQDAYADSESTFEVLRVQVSTDRGRVVTLLLDDEGGLSLDIFDLRNEKIVREYEFILG